MDVNEVINNIHSMGYSKLHLIYNEIERSEFNSIFPGLLDKIRKCVNNSDLFSCTKPDVINSDVDDGFYLIESNHINFEVFVKRKETWFKLNL